MAASGRLLVCDYSCFDHTRVASSQPACHEQAADQTGPALGAAQNDCRDRSLADPGFVIGKVTSLVKPVLTATTVAGLPALSTAAVRIVHRSHFEHCAFALSRFAPLRI